MDRILWWKQACEYLGGEQDRPPPGLPLSLSSPFWGLWSGSPGLHHHGVLRPGVQVHLHRLLMVDQPR